MKNSDLAVQAAPGSVKPSPRERILKVASDLFYREGIRGVGVEEIAQAADTNKMTLYRHFPSKDALVAECLRQLAREKDAKWDAIEAANRGKPRAELEGWLDMATAFISAGDMRGCAFVNAAIELPDEAHPARRVVDEHKTKSRERLIRLCKAAGARQPAALADQLILLVEGAIVCRQSVGPEGPSARVMRLGEALIASNLK